MLKMVKFTTVLRMNEEIQKQLIRAKDRKLGRIIENHIIEDVVKYNNENTVERKLDYVKLILFRDLKERYMEYAHADKICIHDACENALDLYAKMRDGRLNEEEIKKVDFMMMRRRNENSTYSR